MDSGQWTLGSQVVERDVERLGGDEDGVKISVSEGA